MSSVHLRLGLPSGCLNFGLSTSLLYVFLISHVSAILFADLVHCFMILILHHLLKSADTNLLTYRRTIQKATQQQSRYYSTKIKSKVGWKLSHGSRVKVTLVVRPLRKSYAGANMEYSRAKPVLILEYYFARKLLYALREALSDWYSDKYGIRQQYTDW